MDNTPIPDSDLRTTAGGEVRAIVAFVLLFAGVCCGFVAGSLAKVTECSAVGDQVPVSAYAVAVLGAGLFTAGVIVGMRRLNRLHRTLTAIPVFAVTTAIGVGWVWFVWVLQCQN